MRNTSAKKLEEEDKHPLARMFTSPSEKPWEANYNQKIVWWFSNQNKRSYLYDFYDEWHQDITREPVLVRVPYVLEKWAHRTDCPFWTTQLFLSFGLVLLCSGCQLCSYVHFITFCIADQVLYIIVEWWGPSTSLLTSSWGQIPYAQQRLAG